jgi:chromosome segregation ATPase
VYPLDSAANLKGGSVGRKLPPNSHDCFPLINEINVSNKVDSSKQKDIQTIVDSIFGKAVVVKDYQMAMKLSKEFSVTCVTAEYQVVNPGAIVTRVGLFDSKKERITPYSNIKELEKKLIQVLNMSK